MTHKKQKGFSLVELLVVVFMSSLILVAITGLFMYIFGSYRSIRTMQKDVENAQFALNTMSKTLRTSTVMQPTGSTATEEGSVQSAATIYAYDYSTQRCFIFRFSGSALLSGSGATSGADDIERRHNCNFSNSGVAGSLQELTTGTVNGQFYIIPSGDEASGTHRVGRVSISMEANSELAHPVDLQTTVSLHDYTYVGLGTP